MARPCPTAHLHTPTPNGYLAWHEWAEDKVRTHVPCRCPGCGLYKIWRRWWAQGRDLRARPDQAREVELRVELDVAHVDELRRLHLRVVVVEDQEGRVASWTEATWRPGIGLL